MEEKVPVPEQQETNRRVRKSLLCLLSCGLMAFATLVLLIHMPRSPASATTSRTTLTPSSSLSLSPSAESMSQQLSEGALKVPTFEVGEAVDEDGTLKVSPTFFSSRH